MKFWHPKLLYRISSSLGVNSGVIYAKVKVIIVSIIRPNEAIITLWFAFLISDISRPTNKLNKCPSKSEFVNKSLRIITSNIRAFL